MRLLCTTSDKPGSKIIRWGLEERASHLVNLLFDRNGNGIVVHQEIDGFQVEWLPDFMEDNRVIHSLRPKDNPESLDHMVLEALMSEFSGTEYDGGGLVYFAYRAALRRFFDKPLPKRGKWGNGENILCTGQAKVYKKIKPEWFSKEIDDFDIVTPISLYENMLDSGHFIDDISFFRRN